MRTFSIILREDQEVMLSWKMNGEKFLILKYFSDGNMKFKII